MRTIGYKWSGQYPGDFACMCSYCGTFWNRSELQEDEAGLLYCPQEGDGLDAVALSEGNAAGAAEYLGPQPTGEWGQTVRPITDVAPDFTLKLQGGEFPK